MRSPRRSELPLLLAVGLSVLLPRPAAILALGLGVVLWAWWCRPRRREVATLAVPVAAAAAILVVSWLGALQRDPETFAAELDRRWRGVLDQLETSARELAAVPVPTSEDPQSRRDAFERLALESRELPSETTAMLVAGNGEAVAWAGPGLRIDPRAESLPTTGLWYRSGFVWASVAAVVPLDDVERPWRVVVGRSFSILELPFSPPLGVRRDGYRWTIAAEGISDDEDLRLGAGTGAPLLLALPEELVDRQWQERLDRLAILGVAVGLLLLVGQRQLSVALAGSASRRWLGREPGHDFALVTLAAALLGLAGGIAPVLALPLGLVLAAPLAAWHRGPTVARSLQPLLTVLATVLFLVAVGALVVQLRLSADAPAGADLGNRLWASPTGSVARVALWAAVLTGLILVRHRGGDDRGPGPWRPWAALLPIVLGALLLERPLVCAVSLLIALVLLAPWVGGPRTLARLGVSGLLAALLAATAWESWDRIELERRLATVELDRLRPATAEEREAWRAEIESFFAGLDVARLVPGDPDRVSERQDLAYRIWLESPLSAHDGLSSLVVEPGDGRAVTFSYGLGRVESPQERGGETAPGEEATWARAELRGRATLRLDDQGWGQAGFRWLPRPTEGRAAPRAAPGVALLRGQTGAELPAPWNGGAAVVTPSGEVVASSGTAPPIRIAERASGAHDRELGARVWWAAGEDGAIAVVWAAQLDPLAALSRVGVHACGTVLLLLVPSVALVLLGLNRPAFRHRLQREARSYSRRPLVVFTLLVLLPLAGLNLVLFRVVEERSNRAQRLGGEGALRTTQTILADYLGSLEPGYTIDNAVDDELLGWLSQVVRHEVNLYWRGYVYASSRPDLFTAGLMPRRIPGEVFARLSLGGLGMAARTNQVGDDTRYLEIYGPLRLPGEAPAEGRLFLSVPLLAQQVEATEELSTLRRRVVAATTALFLLLLAVGSLLARGFSRPLAEIVDGTVRIAGGADRLDVHPEEPELALLAEAIDDMARRIAEGRGRLETEKRVLEGIVDNVTSAVVSFDRRGRVVMRNRAAVQLLDVAIGDRVAEIGRGPGLQPLAEFLAVEDEGPRRTTLRLRLEAGEEQEWTAVWLPVSGSGDPAALLVVEDVSEVLRAQRLEAWAHMARLIAHEIKNPLTPIRLSAEHLQRVWKSAPQRLEEIFERCTRNILDQVRELESTAADFATYSDILRARPRRDDLVAITRSVVEAYGSVAEAGIELSFAADPDRLETEVDPRLLGRALRNLIENAVVASPRGSRVEVRVAAGDGSAKLSVADRGPGVAEEDLGRIFEPYFSTSVGGSGLGLPIVRRVAEEHGGTATAENRTGGGLQVTITIPLS